MAAMPALPSHLGSFFWLVNFRCFLRSEGPSLGATKGGMLWFNQARGLADQRVACAERVCTTASMDSQTLPPFFLLPRRLSKITRFDWSCLWGFGTAVYWPYVISCLHDHKDTCTSYHNYQYQDTIQKIKRSLCNQLNDGKEIILAIKISKIIFLAS